ncbi:MAG TPA: signal peptidase II [Acidimicrobiales bacterium]|nr:signal peptidase II [Acidimicrobiales bacterium]
MQERRTVAPLTAARARRVVYALAAVVVVADVVVTTLALHHLHRNVHVWGPFGLSLSFNSGFAFSLFSGRAVAVSVLLCFGVALLAVVVGRARTVPQAVGGGLILGGALGNLGERLFGGHDGRVPDFITLTHWPTFNVADACITLGAVVMIVSLLFARPAAT